MASAERELTTPDAATLNLWRVAEDGDVEELASLLRRVPDINACNEHGMTALMRAAQNGRVKMVRALLEHGADANIKRNDKFTALALAAFFGHTEVVRTLMEHGADLRASTRGGTSPQMWATARTFNEVVDELENRGGAKPPLVTSPVKKSPAAPVVREVPAPNRQTAALMREARAGIREARAPRQEGPIVVRTLKDPPEIWDLVHEAPRGFDARSAFWTRLKSMKTGFAFRAATIVVLIGMCVVGVLVLRGVQARSERTSEPPPSVASQPVNSQPNNMAQPVAPAPIAPETVTTPEAETQPLVPTIAETNNAPVFTRKYSAGSRVVSSHRSVREAMPVATEVSQPVAAPVEKSTPPRVEATAKPKAAAPLSPQLITPAKNSTTKAKVIQWP
jgi:hypothetical protein